MKNREELERLGRENVLCAFGGGEGEMDAFGEGHCVVVVVVVTEIQFVNAEVGVGE